VHLIDMTSMPKVELESVAYHEGIPGHHMQVSIAQELTAVPQFRTLARYTAYGEGWGIYAELLAKEMGGYQDPYSDFGRLGSEIWRAIRLVVDTGLHAKGWTEQQAVDYFLANGPTSEGQVRSEIRRYIVMPGQATSYKVGMLKILELRERARTRLGERFDTRSPSIPCTRSWSSTTAAGSVAGPILQVPIGWNVVVPRALAASSNSSSVCTSGPGKSS
jgi:uncharacterized protein (DUF885 family)